MTHAADGDGRDGAIAEARAAAHGVLTSLLEWRLPPPRWVRVAEIIQSLHDAVLRGDSSALESATTDLELLGPIRITRIGSTQEKVMAPTPVRERVNRLQHALIAPSSDPHEEDDRGDGRDRPRDQ